MGDNDDVVVEEFEPVIQNTTPSFISDLMQNGRRLINLTYQVFAFFVAQTNLSYGSCIF